MLNQQHDAGTGSFAKTNDVDAAVRGLMHDDGMTEEAAMRRVMRDGTEGLRDTIDGQIARDKAAREAEVAKLAYDSEEARLARTQAAIAEREALKVKARLAREWLVTEGHFKEADVEMMSDPEVLGVLQHNPEELRRAEEKAELEAALKPPPDRTIGDLERRAADNDPHNTWEQRPDGSWKVVE